MTDASNISCLACWDSAVDPEDRNWCRYCCLDQRDGRDGSMPLCPAGCGATLMEDEPFGPCYECVRAAA